MPSRAHCEVVLQRAREAISRGGLSDEEREVFDFERAREMHRAELRRHPETVEPELPLQVTS